MNDQRSRECCEFSSGRLANLRASLRLREVCVAATGLKYLPAAPGHMAVAWPEGERGKKLASPGRLCGWYFFSRCVGPNSEQPPSTAKTAKKSEFLEEEHSSSRIGATWTSSTAAVVLGGAPCMWVCTRLAATSSTTIILLSPKLPRTWMVIYLFFGGCSAV